eukprot:241883_1
MQLGSDWPVERYAGIWMEYIDVTLHSFKMIFPNPMDNQDELFCSAYLYDQVDGHCYGYYGDDYTSLSLDPSSQYDSGILYDSITCPPQPTPPPTLYPSRQPSASPNVPPTHDPSPQPSASPSQIPSVPPTDKNTILIAHDLLTTTSAQTTISPMIATHMTGITAFTGLGASESQ